MKLFVTAFVVNFLCILIIVLFNIEVDWGIYLVAWTGGGASATIASALGNKPKENE